MSKKIINMFGDGDSNSDKPELRIFNNFTAPFVNDFSKKYGVENTINVCIAAWNLAGMKEVMPSKIHDMLMEFEDFPKSMRKLAHKIFDKKLKDFADHAFIVKDVEMDESKLASGRIISDLTAQNIESIMDELMDDDHDVFGDEDTMEGAMEMMETITQAGYTNRIALICKPKEAFWDWFWDKNPEIPKRKIQRTSVYLIDEDSDLDLWLKKEYNSAFESLLQTWFLDKKDWPPKRTYKMFKEWIDIEVTDMVYDMESKPILKEGLPF